MTEPVRLAKRLAEMLSCSRSAAEQYIEGGWVRVDGVVVETPQSRVLNEIITLDPQATLLESEPMTVLLHKPANVDGADGCALQCLLPAQRSSTDRSGVRLLKRHLKDQPCLAPLEWAATGLVVFSQDPSVQRKFQRYGAELEHELVVDVRGEVPDSLLRALSQPPSLKVTVNSQSPTHTGLRMAFKGYQLGYIANLCAHYELKVQGVKRLRVGKMPLAGLAPGQWRFLQPHERF